MQFSTATLFAILAAAANAATLTNSAYAGIAEGKPFTITWTGASGDVTLTLKNGDSKDLKTVQVLTSTGTSGSFTWTPDKLPSGTYAIEIKDNSGLNYSPQFQFTGTGTASSSSAASSSAASSSAASTSASTASSTSASASASASTTSAPVSSSTTARPSSSTTSGSNNSASSGSSTSPRPTSTNVTNTNDSAKMYGSSLALMIASVAAFVFFN